MYGLDIVARAGNPVAKIVPMKKERKWPAGSPHLGAKAPVLTAADDARLFVSAASWWELSIKRALGRVEVDRDVMRRALHEPEVAFLPVSFDHAEAAATLSALHGDPFDPMLLAQASLEGHALLTRDKRHAPYGSMVMAG
jgi:PIN domain nuclease of toxin-antitoxin system